ncbi:hypothetical protein BTUL_0088g00190 [Botrytis tulipae]|uniref:Uncharacterized protein n=1 Tax=Botrytis tulipae TaxID=87230 RepID=A0A4Z1EPZ8_9HELO|nr:hypothetical protein BTUL_0088g00190 [Botrytis tulipae]
MEPKKKSKTDEDELEKTLENLRRIGRITPVKKEKAAEIKDDVLVMSPEYSRMGQYQRSTVYFVNTEWAASSRTVETLFKNRNPNQGIEQRGANEDTNTHSEGEEESFREESMKDKEK